MAAVQNHSDKNGTNGLADSFLICQVCGNEFNAPKVLPCLHSFCFECLENSLSQSDIGPGQAFLCPICKTQCVVPARGVRSMKSNIFLVTLQEFFHNKTLDPDQQCEGCDSGRAARKKCIECTDWLCNQCCVMHVKVKITKDHHLVSQADLQSGKYDAVMKESFEPLICSKHGEALRLYCTEPSCCAPICTVCKTTLGHDGHDAVPLADQAVEEGAQMQALLPNVHRFITSTATKITYLANEEKLTAHVRKKIHKEINERAEQIVDKVVKLIQDYADGLHEQVEELAKEHRRDVAEQAEMSRNKLQAATSAKAFAEALLGFNRAEELVSMSKEVRARLEDFQKPPDTAPPGWRQPRLNPPAEFDTNLLSVIFGDMTFEGEVTKSVMTKTFSARTQFDDKEPALCDVALDYDGNIIVVDRENRRVKIFDGNGNLKMCTAENALKAPNRVTWLREARRVLVKDDKVLRTIGTDGKIIGYFGDRLKQPVGLTQSLQGEVLVTEWMGGEVVGFDEKGTKVRSFPCSCEAPGYITTSANGNIILSDWKQHVVKLFDRDGKFIRQYGSGQGSGPGQLDHPYGVCTDRYNHIIVADTWNNRIHLLSEECRYIKTMLSKNEGLEFPQAVIVDREGMLIIVEQHGLIKTFQYIA